MTTIIMHTSEGDVTIDLFDDKAPNTVANFLGLADGSKEWTDPATGETSSEPFYDGLIFHRVIGNFMIQGGGMEPSMKEKPTRAPIPLESRNGLSNTRGTLAMARTSVPDSATSQFFINVKDNPFLDQPNSPDGNGYAVFGRVVEGMDVVDKIRAVRTGSAGMHRDVPAEPVLIKKASLEK